jgi:hypothetical protein
LAQLQDLLHSGCYAISIPEEGALLVVAWLVENEHVEQARDLLDELWPFFPRLRFYPAPAARPSSSGNGVFVQDVKRTMADMGRIEPNPRILAQKEAIEVWLPLYDRTVALFLETVRGSLPCLGPGPGDRCHPSVSPVVGGWPCQHYPPGWRRRARVLLDEYRRRRAEHTLCGKPDRQKDSFAQLRHYMQRCIADPRSLNGREVGRIRLILARYVNKRGAPGSARCAAARRRQARQVRAPTFYDIAQVVLARLQACPKESGLDVLDPLVQPITPQEAERYRLPAGTPIPSSQQKKVQRCLSAGIEELVERGIITSGETLARVLPQITAGIQAAGIADPALRRLYGAIYRAFRRRRSLLLLNLESQVRLAELPWIAAIDRFREERLSTQALAGQTLHDVTRLAIASFPHAILPNPLIRELRTLAVGAGVDLPLVEEVAADIFMGAFSDTFRQAARRAAEMLHGTLYETYYGIDYEAVARIEPESHQFARLCAVRAGVTHGWDPATNGMIIEQQQILTTQNLAALFDELDLADALCHRLEELARRCFTWLCRRQQIQSDQWHARLIAIKNAAYGWRQMIFFLSLLSKERQSAFLCWADVHLAEQEAAFRARFRPALQGLVRAAQGRTMEDRPEARRFLGWSNKRHWLLGPEAIIDKTREN